MFQMKIVLASIIGLGACGSMTGGTKTRDDPPPPPPRACQDTVIELPIRNESPTRCEYQTSLDLDAACRITSAVVQGTAPQTVSWLEWERANDLDTVMTALGQGSASLGGPGWQTSSFTSLNATRPDWGDGDYLVRIDPSQDGNIPCAQYGSVQIALTISR
jgi:hypothetical protein